MTDTRSQAADAARLYLDFDSFFASAEQHFNPALRGRPVGVVPLDAVHTGCIAVSRQAKQLGVRSGMTIRDARAIIPDMVFVVARHDVYVRLHQRILAVIDGCVPIAHVRSIDEVVCHLLPSEAQDAPALAARIKARLAAAFSPGLTCSIGIGPTELLAKIAAELNKPDGTVMLRTADLPGRLAGLPLGDLPGISKGMQARLHAAGVQDFTGLWGLAAKQARMIWGSVEGERFWNGLHGHHSERPATQKGMFGHSRMLPRDWRTPDRIATCARLLTASAARRLRRTDMRATRLTLGLRGGGHPGARGVRSAGDSWQCETGMPPTRDDHGLLLALARGLDAARTQVRFRPRSVSVMLHGLIAEDAMIADLFGTAPGADGAVSDDAVRARWEQVSDVMDALRVTHGPQAITLGPPAQMPGGYLGAKIAFGRIPDAADFSHAPVADDATQFVTV